MLSIQSLRPILTVGKIDLIKGIKTMKLVPEYSIYNLNKVGKIDLIKGIKTAITLLISFVNVLTLSRKH